MKRTSKYVGLDVHQATTVVSVRERSGRVIFRGVLPTEAGPLVEFFRGLADMPGLEVVDITRLEHFITA